MHAFAGAWPDQEFVQQLDAQSPWGHNLLLDRLNTQVERRWYTALALDHGWSRNVLHIRIETRFLERTGRAVTHAYASIHAHDIKTRMTELFYDIYNNILSTYEMMMG
jgi:hypothetical protein